ncbi:MAG: hypothetical protein HFE84_05735 [Lachnospiraceae bacterium]|nr:hypothetical protein [Lachnospiraceae bacterium]
MNKIKKTLAAGFALLMLTAGCLSGRIFTSYAATGKITFSDPSATVGNQVSVNMKITSAEGALGSSDVMLEYDASALRFESGTGASGDAGRIRVVGAMESTNQKTFSFTLKFTALKAGTTNITVQSQEVYDPDSAAVSISHVGSSAIKVNAPATASHEAALASLAISPGELSPAFSEEVTDYTATVAGVDSVVISAPAKDSKASVSVSGNDAIQMGENTVVCQVTAEDGTTTKTYTITVTKVEGEAPPGWNNDSSEGPNDSSVDVFAESGNWEVSETFDAGLLPAGFILTETEYSGKQVQAGVDERGTLLLYMTDENGNGDFFFYDPVDGTLTLYVTVLMAEKTIIVLSPDMIPEDVTLPEGFKDCNIDIGTHTVHGWIWGSGEGPAEYCVVYGMNEDGERNFYRYDQKEMTLQRYFQDPDAVEWKTKYTELALDHNNLIDDFNLRGKLVAGLFAGCIVLVILLIVLLLVRRPRDSRDGGRSRYSVYEDEEPAYRARPVKRTAVQTARPTAGQQPSAREHTVRNGRETADYEDLEIEDLNDFEDEAPVRMTGLTRRQSASEEQAAARDSGAGADYKKVTAKEAAVRETAAAEQPAEDDDLEFIDLDE